MHAFIQKFAEEYKDQITGIIRILVALLFIEHPLSLLFGLFGGTATIGGAVGGTMPTFSFIGIVSLVELILSIALIVGVFSRAFALLGFFIMIGAYFMAHLKNGIIPIVDKGELALLYGFVFFMLAMVTGSGSYAVDNWLLPR